MSEPTEGSWVSYIGRPENGPQMGDQGRLLAVTGSSGHVKWEGGDMDGRLTLTRLDDLVTTAGSSASRTEQFAGPEANNLRTATIDDLDDSLEFGHTASLDEDDDLLRDYWNEG